MQHHFSFTGVSEGSAAQAGRRDGPGCELPDDKIAEAEDIPAAADLGRIIEAEIIPRLMLTNQCTGGRSDTKPVTFASPHLLQLTQLVLGDDPLAALSYIEGLQKQGLPSRIVFLDFLAPTVRHLEDLWASEHCDFVAVSIGLRRLHDILQVLSHGRDVEPATVIRRALLIPAGETDGGDIVLAEQSFHAVGWHAQQASATNYVTVLRDEWFSVAAFYLDAGHSVEILRKAVRAARQASKNPSLIVLVGGAILRQNEDLAELVGADCAAADVSDAFFAVQHLLKPSAIV